MDAEVPRRHRGGTDHQRSRARLYWLLGALAMVVAVYLCLPRSWFTIPSPDRSGASGASTTPPRSNAIAVPPSQASLDSLRAEAAATPLDFGARSRYGMALAAAGRGSEALEEFRAAARLAPESPGVHHNLGVFYLNNRRPKEADAAFCLELELAPGDGRAHYFRGQALQARGLDAQAVAQFRLAIALLPDFPDPYFSLAMRAAEKQPIEQTRGLLESFVRHGGDKTVADFVLSRAYREKHQYAEAASYAENTVQRAPNSYSYWHNLGQIYSYARRTADADRALRRALELARDKSTVYIELGMNEQNAGRFAGALEFFEKALAASPGSGSIHMYLSRAYQRLGDNSSAAREEAVFRKWFRANKVVLRVGSKAVNR